MRYEIYPDNSLVRRWRWRLVDDEGEIIATSHQGHILEEICWSEIFKVKKSSSSPVEVIKTP